MEKKTKKTKKTGTGTTLQSKVNRNEWFKSNGAQHGPKAMMIGLGESNNMFSPSFAMIKPAFFIICMFIIYESYMNHMWTIQLFRISWGHLKCWKPSWVLWAKAPKGVADPEALARRAGRANQDCRAAHQLERTVFHGWGKSFFGGLSNT